MDSLFYLHALKLELAEFFHHVLLLDLLSFFLPLARLISLRGFESTRPFHLLLD